MRFDFLCEHLSEYEIERFNDDEYIYIKKQGFDNPIEVYWEEEYLVVFATYHWHIDRDEELLATVLKLANSEMAVIEFYKKGKACFCGQIEGCYLDNLTYDALGKCLVFLPPNIAKMTFRVYGWKKEYCFEGWFENGDKTKLVKRFYSQG